MAIPAFITLLLSIPVLILGEFLVGRIRFLDRFNIPTPIAGGLAVAIVVLILNATNLIEFAFHTKVSDQWWTWLTTIEPVWLTRPSREVAVPFMVAFFTCIGLNASWSLVKQGSIPLLIFFGISVVLAVLQNGVGVFLAKAMCQVPILGIVCGSASLTGGHGTVLGFADLFKQAGLTGADTLGLAAATFGLTAGGLLGGPLAVRMIRKYHLKSKPGMHSDENELEPEEELPAPTHSSVLKSLSRLFLQGKTFWMHLILIMALIKIGAWVSYFIQKPGFIFEGGMTFPVYMGSMIIGVLLRNILDFTKSSWQINSELVDSIGSISLSIFLAVAIMSVNLLELMGTAVPMMIILFVQVIICWIFAYYTLPLFMGKTYDVAVMSAGLIGFGLGSTSSAVANMRSLVDRFGPSPQAFIIVPVVGAFLIDFANALNITVFTNIFW
jgi:ESS family glutamate:Na+ symporter